MSNPMNIPMHRFKYTKLTKSQIGEKLKASAESGPVCRSEITDEPDDSGTGTRIEELSERIVILEAEKSISGLYHTYESLLNNGKYDQIPELFAADGESVYNGGGINGVKTGYVNYP